MSLESNPNTRFEHGEALVRSHAPQPPCLISGLLPIMRSKHFSGELDASPLLESQIREADAGQVDGGWRLECQVTDCTTSVVINLSEDNEVGYVRGSGEGFCYANEQKGSRSIAEMADFLLKRDSVD